MLKKTMCFCLFIAICLLIPILFVDGNIENVDNKEEKIIINEHKNDNDDDDSNGIRLLLSETNDVVEMPLEEYIKGVVLAEMPIDFELEALKAQAIVARTYTLYKIKNHSSMHENADVCDDINCCQAYKTKEYAFASWDDDVENVKWEKLERAVNETKGEVITYSGEIIEAFFHAHSGGQTEDVKYLWKEEEMPYLKSVSGMESDLYSDSKTFSNTEFTELIKPVIREYNYKTDKIAILNYTGSGRVYNLKIGEEEIKATKLRSITGIKSTNFRIEQDEKSITFYTVGYGHGVGMSQYGANQMALDGKSAEEIINYYYTEVDISHI